MRRPHRFQQLVEEISPAIEEEQEISVLLFLAILLMCGIAAVIVTLIWLVLVP